ncbi:hypothetical protein ACOME3_000140 [Neoechinorhynchus agilis]
MDILLHDEEDESEPSNESLDQSGWESHDHEAEDVFTGDEPDNTALLDSPHGHASVKMKDTRLNEDLDSGTRGTISPARFFQGKQILLDAMSESEMSVFDEEIFDRHNWHRLSHGVPKLEYNEELDKIANDQVGLMAATDQVAHLDGEQMTLSTGEDFGQTVIGADGLLDPKNIVDTLVSEYLSAQTPSITPLVYATRIPSLILPTLN